MERLEIQAYGISITTLEDVFMKVGHMSKPENVLADEPANEIERADAFGT
jgi:hypothetical protein